MREFLGKELQRNVATEFDVFRFIDDTHPAAANLAQDAVMGNCLTHGLGRSSHLPEMVRGRRVGVNLAILASNGKVHFLYQTDEIQKARAEGRLRVNSFTRLEKDFSEEGRPLLHIEDLGDASELLQNNAYLCNAALTLIQQGVSRVERTWTGWLGQYQDAIEAHLSKARQRGHDSRARGLAR